MNNSKIDFHSFSTQRHSRKVKAKKVDKIKYLNRIFPSKNNISIPGLSTDPTAIKNILNIKFNLSESYFIIQTPSTLYIFENYRKSIIGTLLIENSSKVSLTFLNEEEIFVLYHNTHVAVIYNIPNDNKTLINDFYDKVIRQNKSCLQNDDTNLEKNINLENIYAEKNVIALWTNHIFFLVKFENTEKGNNKF